MKLQPRAPGACAVMSLATSLALLLPVALQAQRPAQTPAQVAKALPSIAEKTQGMEKMDGLFPLYWDSATGKIWLEIPELDKQFLYVESLPAGMGSNDIGLDRAQLGDERIVTFQRVGPRVLMVQPNLEFRAITDNGAERRDVEDSFARSVLWGFEVAAESDGQVLVDATDFAIRDAHDVIGTLKQTGQGTFHLDRDRSAVYLPHTKAFPKNTEIEVTLTFTGDQPGRWVRQVTPTPSAITVRERHSLIELPGPGFNMIRNRPGAGYFGIEYRDYASSLGSDITQRFIIHHRLQKKDPGAAMSDPVKPIVYYLDAGVPEPIRSALLQGARWWNQAFEAAGYRNAFRVEMMPDSVDPMDVRYNVIEWVHRATRGWSYGSSIIDPRTGEIIQGHVLLGSLRARQDYLIGRGLLDPYRDGDADTARITAMVLARMRQLAAHETGHTLGLAHNYIASAEGRASVMDYPYPLVKLDANGRIDLSDAYATGIGAWDKVAIAYGYEDFPAGLNDDSARAAILTAARGRGLIFLSDQDARPAGSVHPQVHLWDNGTDPAAELERVLKVRDVALANFSDAVIRDGTPLATMEEALVPIYLFHRYQVTAASKAVGGEYYTYADRGDGQVPVRRVPAAQQTAALDALISTISPAELALPRSLLDSLPPRPYLYPSHRELFQRYTELAFDAVSPATIAADMTISAVLYPSRAARLVEQHAIDPSLPGLSQVIDRLVQATFGARPSRPYEQAINRAVRRVLLDNLLVLGATAPMPEVRARVDYALESLRKRLAAVPATAPEADRAQAFAMVRDIQRYMRDPTPFAKPVSELEPPPGDPIGQAMIDYLGQDFGW
jgi:Met-zincin/Domain of unknown function (DUF5117)